MTQPLLQQTAAALQSLCVSCGLRKTGAKRILIQRLRLAARQFQPLAPDARILSIDLGLKNFAFSLLSPASPLPPLSTSRSKPKSKSKSTNTITTTNKPPLTSPVNLHAWHRLDLTLPTQTATTRKKGAPEVEGDDPFSPAALAALTVHLVQTRLLPLRPTHVLIERQRFRTGGAAAVFEWTVRVNTLEAMLHAAFAALNGAAGSSAGSRDDDGVGDGGVVRVEGDSLAWRGRVDSVLPRMVVGFLFPPAADGEVEAVAVDGRDGDAAVEGDGNAVGKKKGGDGKKVGMNASSYQMLKREKVDVLGRLLTGERLVLPDNGQPSDMRRLFLAALERRGKKGGRRKKGEGNAEEKEVEDLVTKLDDLSDAVLQGMVWLQWQRNLEALIKERPELLDETDEE